MSVLAGDSKITPQQFPDAGARLSGLEREKTPPTESQGAGVAAVLPRVQPLSGAGKGRLDLCAWSHTEPGEGPLKASGEGEKGSSSLSGWGSVFPGMEGTEQKANVYLMTFLSRQPPF